MSKSVFRVAILALCFATLLGWRGAMRAQDLKVYRISLPFVVERGSAFEDQWRAVDIRALSGSLSEHNSYRIEIDFEAVPPKALDAPVRSVTMRYHVTLRDAELVSVEPIVRPRVSDDQVGAVWGDAEPRALLRRVAAEDAVAWLHTENKSFRYTKSGSGSEQLVSLAGLSAIDNREFITVQRLSAPQGDPQQSIVLLQVPAKESPDTDLRVLPLVDLTKVGFVEETAGVALLADYQTMAIISSAALSEAQAGKSELWLVRLPGRLKVSNTPMYVAATLSILVAGVLLTYGFLRK